MFPPEIITFVITFILRVIADKVMQSGEDRRAEVAMREKVLDVELKAQNDIRSRIPMMLFGATNSLLAIIAFTCIFGVRIIAPIFVDVPVYFAFHETSRGFLMFDSVDKMQYMVLPGITLLPIDTHIASAIGGAYFGKASKR